MKKRKKGFKRKGASADKTVGTAAEPGKVTLEATENESRVGAKNVPVQEHFEAKQRSGGAALQNQTEMLEKSGASAGGLASFLNQQQENNADGSADEVLSSGSDVVENSAVNNGVAGNDAAGNRAEKNGAEKSDVAENGAVGKDATGNGATNNGVENNGASENGIAGNDDFEDGDFDIFTDEDFKALQL